MKTSMAYRLFRLYFNSNSDNYHVFGNRVHNPLNGGALQRDMVGPSLARAIIVALAICLLLANAL